MNRKKFLQTSLAGVAGFISNNTFTKSKTHSPLPLSKDSNRKNDLPFDQVKITNVKAYPHPRATFVKVETDAGVSGWGEGDHDHPKLVQQVVETVCKKELIGQDPFQSEYLWNRMYFKGEDLGQSGLLPGAIAGIDNALWDLKGKLLNIPVHKLLGGVKKTEIRVYGSFGRSAKGGYRNAEEMAVIATDFVSQGYKAIKARMQIRQLNVNPYPDETFNIIKAVRKAIGDDTILYVDYNNGYTAAKAIEMTNRLYEHFNIAGVEEPVSYQNYRDLAQVVASVDVPILAGEHEFNKWQVRELILTGNVDVINSDLIKAGGITENKKVAAMAQAFDKPIMVHSTRPTLGTAAALQFVASISNAGRFQEYAGPRPSMKLDQYFENKIQYKAGFLEVPQLPGLGLVVNEKKMEELRNS